MGYENFGEIVPGVTLMKSPRSKYLIARIYKRDVQKTVNRSTGCLSVEDAKNWVLQNLGTLFQEEVVSRGGGNTSIQRHLVKHVEWQRRRFKAGFIAESTYEGYAKSGRHFMKWFAIHGYKKLADIQRNSLVDYGLDRINNDGMSPNTAQFEIVFLRAWWKWLQDEEILSRPLRVNAVQKAVENRTGGEPFAGDDLKLIYKTIDEWIESDTKKQNFGNKSVPTYNKKLFRLWVQLLDECGARQHEIHSRTQKDVKVLKTNTRRERYICQISIPQSAKRGARQSVFRGDSLLQIKALQKQMCPKTNDGDYLFRHHQTNTLIDISTFTRYWRIILDKAGLDYKIHTLRSHRITQLILGGTQAQLVGRNLGLSLKQIEKTYLRYSPAGHFDQLVQKELPEDRELSRLM